MTILLIFMNIALSSASDSVSWSGNLGGAMVGLFWGMATFPRAPGRGGEKQRLFGMMATTTFFVLFGYLFFSSDF